ncbi:MAG: UDP-3-O-(3-hydroxymyristoyl)glucosamine N-acyltransferase [Bacteroidales bacterium]|jgi:UDP-3-O-[3-hydroxymyristoyl] glucosamine N-acyltransferase|nr:UDP-3-O-(3-hydroxymyristoyl)glucosamine N-acyltransferase [Bacteroidales bacterium]
MDFTAQQIAQLLGGSVVGDEKAVVCKLCKIEEGEQGGLAFLSNPKYNHYLYQTQASIVIIDKSFEVEHPVKATLIKVEDARGSFARLLSFYNQTKFNRNGISSLSFVDKDARFVDKDDVYVGEFAVISANVEIGKGTKIFPQVFIGDNVKIGDNVVLYAGVKIYNDCVIGNNCILHSGSVIGADGFGFVPAADGKLQKIEQIGNVIIEDDVEIGANATIDRSTMGSTKILRGAKIDNLCQVGHNCVIGNDTAMSAQVGVAGSCKIGSNCFVGGQAGFAGHLSVGDRSQIGAQSGVISDLKADSKVVGAPSLDAKSYMKSYFLFSKLPDLNRKIAELERKIKEFESKQ